MGPMKESAALKIAIQHHYHGRDGVGKRTEWEVIYQCFSRYGVRSQYHEELLRRFGYSVTFLQVITKC